MASFTLNNDYHFLRFFDTHDLNNPFGVAVKEMSQKPDGNIHEGKSILARLHPGITTFSNKLEIYGLVIDGFKLQQLIEEIHDGDLVVNRQADEKTKSAGSDSEKTKGVIYQKEKLKKLESQLQVKKEDLRHREEEYEKLKKEVKTLRAAQNKGIMGSVYREYCRDKSFEKRLQQLFAVSGEMHVVLAFARDYDESDIHTDGAFRVSFDQENVTPQFIANFKKNLPPNSIVKFFLCIGNRNEKYPFRIVHKDKWIAKATSSLQGIIKRYGFDGIDVYYTRIHTQFKDFVDAIGTVINNLMINGTITTASLAPCHFMNAMSYEFYDELYNRNHHIFDYVVYQTHDDAHSNPLNNPQALITDFNDLVSNHNYPKHKLLVGHSILLKDWDAVPYPVILSALPQLFRDDTVKGTSVWTLTENLE
ncbi:ruBisCO-associated protein-like [Senna tora]|uniref:RuBisCO-associated protein-like n=1 Tax=Senna tora TaxID=362788 RepID=A0A835CNA5_9FABA|nr:ruBisCO-associated protein-like [Senna tora]